MYNLAGERCDDGSPLEVRFSDGAERLWAPRARVLHFVRNAVCRDALVCEELCGSVLVHYSQQWWCDSKLCVCEAASRSTLACYVLNSCYLRLAVIALGLCEHGDLSHDYRVFGDDLDAYEWHALDK